MTYIPRNNIMIDLESLDVVPGGVILSVGACTFDLVTVFYAQIEISDSMNNGFTINESTRRWWQEQPAAIRNEAFSGTLKVTAALRGLSQYVKDIAAFNGSAPGIWGNGADFDVPMLNAAYDKMNIPRPWSHRDSRCFRTLKNLFDVEEPERQGDKHNALADAMHQARWADKILRSMTNGSTK